MELTNFGEVYTVDDPSDIERFVSKRFGDGFNEVVLSPEDRPDRFLQILLRDELAALYYAPGEDVAGFVSVGGKLGLPPGKDTAFASGHPGNRDMLFSSEQIVSTSEALAAAKEFFYTEELPKSIEWFEL
jgi:hypothetical protein